MRWLKKIFHIITPVLLVWPACAIIMAVLDPWHCHWFYFLLGPIVVLYYVVFQNVFPYLLLGALPLAYACRCWYRKPAKETAIMVFVGWLFLGGVLAILLAPEKLARFF